MTQHFESSPRPTLGVEWELALIDPATRDLVPSAAEVVDIINQRHSDVHVELEFLANTVELVTPVCSTVSEAVSYLSYALSATKEAAESLGLKLWGAGSHPFAIAQSQPRSKKEHYEEIIARTQYWGSQMLIWGIHTHVGISDKERVWPIINALLTKYPHLLALTASSPGWEGTDTGYASNRTMLYQQLPTAGLPYQFANWAAWESYMRDQDISGVINHTGSMHFDIRPAGKWGTIEVRICDSTANIDDLAAVVALTHCLVVHYDRMIDAGETLPTLQDWHVAENKWRAARYGLEALVIVDRETNERPVVDDLHDLVAQLMPVAEELQCTTELQHVTTITSRGGSYQKQRELFRRYDSWIPAVDAVIEELY